jgi:hypothetical protein
LLHNPLDHLLTHVITAPSVTLKIATKDAAMKNRSTTYARQKKIIHGKPVPMPLGVLVLKWMAEPKFELKGGNK